MKIISSTPAKNQYFQDISAKAQKAPVDTEGKIINIYDDVVYQSILGFGGAFTEASAYNYSLMDDETKKAFIKAYFDKKDGLGYNFGRTHINSCDFALDIYTYVEEGDKTLDTFNIERDKKYIIPFLKDALEYAQEEIVLFASPWSPPSYMKDNNSMIKGGKLLDEYKKLWALYYTKYIKAYKEEGINIGAISVQNEPKALQTWESCSYSAKEEREFIENYLIPVFDEEGLSDVKIIIWDHNKERVYDRAKEVLSSEKVNKRVWAVGHHWYTGDHFDALTLVEQKLKKPNICTEFCASLAQTSDMVALAERYAREICENLNNYCIGICDWNLMLDTNGGPYHNRLRAGTSAIKLEYTENGAGCYAPIMCNEKEGTFDCTPMYYYIGHFSRYIKRGAKRIATTKYSKDIYTTAFLNPDGEKIVCVINCADTENEVVLRNNDECTQIVVEPHSIITVMF